MQQKGVSGLTVETRTFWQLFRDDDAAKTSFVHRRILGEHKVSSRVLTATPLSENAPDCMVLAAEQYRLLRTRVIQICRSKRGNVLLITSALAGEGKTLTAINLSYSLASLENKRVLYVELDLRRPSAHTLLGLRSDAGSTTFLESKRPWQECIHKLTSNLDVLLAYNPSQTPNDTLHKDELAIFLTNASKQYDVVILDTAPLLATVDTEAVLPLVNSVLFLIRADKTPIDCVRDALALVGEKAVGIVLNGTNTLKYRDYYYGYQDIRFEKNVVRQNES